PFFASGSTHRYDAWSFEHVDPLLGGDEALASLTAAAHARGLRVLGDLTVNHVGVGHDWFRRAQDEPDSAERGFFWFDERLRHGSASWYGVRDLPPPNHTSAELGARLGDVVEPWLRPPYSLDGWRIDVANMAARYGAFDGNHALARAVRSRVAAVRPDG